MYMYLGLNISTTEVHREQAVISKGKDLQNFTEIAALFGPSYIPAIGWVKVSAGRIYLCISWNSFPKSC